MLQKPHGEEILRKLIVVSGSTRLRKEPIDPIPAIERFDGVSPRLLRKYRKQLRNSDIFLLSPVYGLINAEDKIALKEPVKGSWGEPILDANEILRLRRTNLSTLRKLLSKRKYDEIYVNVGRKMLRTMDGFEELVPQTVKITYSQGESLGLKMAHMKKWIKSLR